MTSGEWVYEACTFLCLNELGIASITTVLSVTIDLCVKVSCELVSCVGAALEDVVNFVHNKYVAGVSVGGHKKNISLYI